MADDVTVLRFEQAVLPHLDAAYNLARWLLRDDHDAEDICQQSCLRAFDGFARFRGGDTRAWLRIRLRSTFGTSGQNRNHQHRRKANESFHAGPDSAWANPFPRDVEFISRGRCGNKHTASCVCCSSG